MPPNNTRLRAAERGNVFIFILLGLVLFAALSYTVSRSFRSDTTNQMTERQAELAASEILSYAQRIERAVNRLRREGCSENGISFEHAGWGHTQYEHTPAAPDNCKVFHPAGGDVKWRGFDQLYPNIVDHPNRLIFVGHSEIVGFGNDCVGDASCAELYMYLRMIHAQGICEKLNKFSGISLPLPVVTGLFGTPRFNGTFQGGGTSLGTGANGTEFVGKISGCYEDISETHSDGTPFYDFYYVLIAR